MSLMKLFLQYILLGALFASTAIQAQTDFEVQVARYDWPQKNSADAILQIPQLRRAIARFIETENAQLIVRYPGGDAGNEWAIQLHDNFVSLGIESSRISLEPGSGVEETILVIVSSDEYR